MKFKYTREKIKDGMYLNLISTKKFKTNLISIYIIRPLIRDEVTKNALIPLVLKRGTNNYERAIDIEKRLDELYGSNLSIDVSKKGERQVLRFTIEGPQEELINMKDLFKYKLILLNDILNNPLIEDGKFKDSYVMQEKNNLKNKINSRINDKKSYAIDRCIEEMFKNQAYSLYKYGYVEDLNKINSGNLFNHYRNIIKNSPIEISIVGEVEKDECLKQIKNIFNIERENLIKIPYKRITDEYIEQNEVIEKLDINQGKLTLGYKTNISYDDELYEALLLASNILGGGPHSKLFINVREKNSLAYYIYSQIYKFKSLLMIGSGIDFDNYNKAVEIIKNQVSEMKQGNFSNKDVEKAKKALITSLKTLSDSNYSISEFYLTNALTDENKKIQNIIERIENTSKSNITEAINRVNLDTIYFLNKR